MKRDRDESTTADAETPHKRMANMQFFHHDARDLREVVESNSVDLVVTSPPYPMISMWDKVFQTMDSSIPDVSEWTTTNANFIFERMHVQLDKVWNALFESVKSGGIVAINIGDATRSIQRDFRLFPNGARTTMGMMNAGFTPLPNILWKKPTNRPNAFLGSGFYPVNAYITLDCEHILLFRKRRLRKFPKKDPVREASRFTKDERNLWFSQIWTDIRGTKQRSVANRRTGAFPEQIPSRLIRMFSVLGDMVFDPFVGTGTTARAAISIGRSFIGLDIDAEYISYAMTYSGVCK